MYCVDEVTFNVLIDQNLQIGLAPRFVAVISSTRVNWNKGRTCTYITPKGAFSGLTSLRTM